MGPAKREHAEKRHYRITHRDSIGRVVADSDVICSSEAKAYATAWKQVQPGCKTELWCGPRLVGKVKGPVFEARRRVNA
jgi:hypothetical protein